MRQDISFYQLKVRQVETRGDLDKRIRDKNKEQSKNEMETRWDKGIHLGTRQGKAKPNIP